MKKNATIQHSSIANNPSDRHRKPLPRAFRYLVITFLVLGLLLSATAQFAAFRPFVITLPTPMFAYRQSTRPSYTVNLTANPYFAEAVQPAGRTYLREFVQSVSVRFDSTFRTILSGDLIIRSRIDAVLRVRDSKDDTVVLLEKTTNLKPMTDTPLRSGHETVGTDAEVALLSYQQTAGRFLQETGLSGRAELVVRYTADAVGSRYDQVLTDHQESSVTIPLLTDQFRITTDEAAANRLLIRPVRYRVNPTQVPLFVFPLAIGCFLVLLILFLLLTRNRKADRFRRDVRKMLRYARKQLLLIGDKAWEPEWCITASDFKSLVRTARKLNHPVFCHVHDGPDEQAAYFYVYYGENNYCYTFRGQSDRLSAASTGPNGSAGPAGSAGSAGTAGFAGSARSDVWSDPTGSSAAGQDFLKDAFADEPSTAVIPLLPETDDSPDAILERLRREPGSFPF